MNRVRIQFVLPVILRLPEGDYAIGSHEPFLVSETWISRKPDGLQEPRTRISSFFDADETLTPEAQRSLREQQARSLLRKVNRLIRWYRVATGQAALTEVTLAKVSPVEFMIEPGNTFWGEGSFSFEPDPIDSASPPRTPAEIASEVRMGLATGDPPVASLFLLDARQALLDGRFREAVLFSWSTIDATFNKAYARLVTKKLAGDWEDGLDFLTGFDFGLRYKMSVGLNLLAGRSLFQEPDSFWERLSTSYNKRNKIIHEGQNATEEDAKASVHVARRLVDVLGQISPD